MALSAPALVNHEMLVWAREQAGYSLADAAKRVRVDETRLRNWEQGLERASVAQARALAAFYRRPFALFYLRQPPRTYDAYADFRRLPGTFKREASPSVLWAIRKARYRRQAAIDLTNQGGDRPPRFEERAVLAESPKQVGVQLRARLGVSIEEQMGFHTPHMAFNAWREAAEGLGLLVFQVSRIAVEEMRALCLPDDPFPTILLNSADHPHGRIFSLLHEMAHLCLARGGEFGVESQGRVRPEDRRVEVFANAVAAAALLPDNVLLADPVVKKEGERSDWPDDVLKRLSRRYSVSAEMILRRLVTLRLASEEMYQVRRNFWEEEERRRPKEKPEGAPPMAVQALSQVGRAFGRLVLDSYRRGVITLNDVSNYFDMKPKWLHEFEQHLAGSPLSPRAMQ